MLSPGKEEQIKTLYIWSPDHYSRHWCPRVVWPTEAEHIVALLRKEAKQTRKGILMYDDETEG